jgi:3-deoxy-7-phosphoheptulonate synthase
MIIVMSKGASNEAIQNIIAELSEMGLQPMPLYGTERTVIAVIGDERIIDERSLAALPGVSKVMMVLQPFKLASRESKFEDTIIEVKGEKIGGKNITIIAGPCSIESEKQLFDIAFKCRNAGTRFLRGGAFKPRTSPHQFQGLGVEGLKIMKKVCDELDMISVSEVMDARDVEVVSKNIDILQIGARNMQNFTLLKEVGKTNLPILLKRGSSATIKEFLLAAEYIMSEGNHKVILCERGIRTFETDTRNTLPLATVPLIKELSHLPIIVDPSHGTGVRSFVSPMSKAAIAAGADGLAVEVHTDPDKSITDADQTISCESFAALMDELKPIADAIGRSM